MTQNQHAQQKITCIILFIQRNIKIIFIIGADVDEIINLNDYLQMSFFIKIQNSCFKIIHLA